MSKNRPATNRTKARTRICNHHESERFSQAHVYDDKRTEISKKYRFTIVNRLHDLTLDIFQHIQEANELDLTDPQEYRERRYEQKKALTECKTVLFLIELSFEKELISSGTMRGMDPARYEREEHDGKVEEAG